LLGRAWGPGAGLPGPRPGADSECAEAPPGPLDFAGCALGPEAGAASRRRIVDDRPCGPPETGPLAGEQGPPRQVLVLDPEGRPVAGARIHMGAIFDADGKVRGGRLCATTDWGGRAHLEQVEPGAWISVHGDGFRLHSLQVPPREEAWVVALQRANRLEIVLLGAVDPAGFHVELELDAAFRDRSFYQDKYVTTPGRVVDGTVGCWERRPSGSRWSLGFGAGGRAVVDQLADDGPVSIALCRFGREIERRALELRASRGATRVEFAPPAPPPPPLRGRVLDLGGRPVCGARIRLAPLASDHDWTHWVGWIGYDENGGFHVWAPMATTAADGSFAVARPADREERCVVTRRGFADRVLTVAELEDLGGRVVLEPGRVVRLEAVDRNGAPLDGGWSSGIAYNYARPCVHIGRGIWRWPSARDHTAAAGRPTDEPPFFIFADLPAGVLRFRFTHMRESEGFEHDTLVESARFVAREAVADLHIGK